MQTGIRHLVSIDDLSLAEILALFEHAKALRPGPARLRTPVPGADLGQPLLRALDAHAALVRVGHAAPRRRRAHGGRDEGQLGAARASRWPTPCAWSAASYADVIVLRHSSEGAARLAAQLLAGAGDQRAATAATSTPPRRCATSTTCGSSAGASRASTSCSRATCATAARSTPSSTRWRASAPTSSACRSRGSSCRSTWSSACARSSGSSPCARTPRGWATLRQSADAVYLTPQKPHQLSLFTAGEARSESPLPVERVDALYMTRPQTERYPGRAAGRDQVRAPRTSSAWPPSRCATRS